MALLCVGLFAGAMALQTIQPATEPTSILWNSFQFGLPLLLGGLLLTGKPWALMVGVIYGTIGMALDIATLVQSTTEGHDSIEFKIVILMTTILNFLLIVLGGQGMLKGH